MLGPFARGRDGEVDLLRRQQVSVRRGVRSGGGQSTEELRGTTYKLKRDSFMRPTYFMPHIYIFYLDLLAQNGIKNTHKPDRELVATHTVVPQS